MKGCFLKMKRGSLVHQRKDRDYVSSLGRGREEQEQVRLVLHFEMPAHHLPSAVPDTLSGTHLAPMTIRIKTGQERHRLEHEREHRRRIFSPR